MSANCINCVKNPRTGPDLMCDECRAVSSFAAPTGLGDNKAMAEELINLVGAVDRQRASIIALSAALKDAISTYGPKPEILVTAERQEAWQAVLDKHGVA